MPLNLDKGDIDVSKWNKFEQDQASLFDGLVNNLALDNNYKHRIFIDGGADSFANYQYINKFCSGSEADRVTADEAGAVITKTVEEQYDDVWMKNIK